MPSVLSKEKGSTDICNTQCQERTKQGKEAGWSSAAKNRGDGKYRKPPCKTGITFPSQREGKALLEGNTLPHTAERFHVGASIRHSVHHKYWILFWAPHYYKGIEVLEHIQRSITKLVKGLERECYEVRLREWRLCSLGKKEAQGRPFHSATA